MSRRPCRNRRLQSSCWTRSLDRRADAGLVFLEVFAEQIGELRCRRVVSRGFGPRTARPQNVPRHTGTLGRHVKAKEWIAPGLCFRERAVGEDALLHFARVLGTEDDQLAVFEA